MQTNPAVEQSKIIRRSKSPWNQCGRMHIINSMRVKKNSSCCSSQHRLLHTRFKMNKVFEVISTRADPGDGEGDISPPASGNVVNQLSFPHIQHLHVQYCKQNRLSPSEPTTKNSPGGSATDPRHPSLTATGSGPDTNCTSYRMLLLICWGWNTMLNCTSIPCAM